MYVGKYACTDHQCHIDVLAWSYLIIDGSVPYKCHHTEEENKVAGACTPCYDVVPHSDNTNMEYHGLQHHAKRA